MIHISYNLIFVTVMSCILNNRQQWHQMGTLLRQHFFPLYPMTWIAIIISRLCVILACWQVFTHAPELKVGSQGQWYLPRHSITDTKCEWHGTVRCGNCRGCLLWSPQQIPLKAGERAPSPVTPSNHLPLLLLWNWGHRQCYLSGHCKLMNITKHWRCLGGNCYCKLC